MPDCELQEEIRSSSEKAPFLGRERKWDIFYGSAAHFPRLSEDVVARHREM